MVVICFVDDLDRPLRSVQAFLDAVVRAWDGRFLGMVRLI